MKQSAEEIEIEKWLAIRKEAGRKIDPETAEVTRGYGCEIDPYGILPGGAEEYGGSGKHYFARSPGSDIWVWFGDIPDQICDALWEKQIEREEWLAIRKEAGRKIDPETAEVDWHYVHSSDPYGIFPEVPKEYGFFGRHYFARSPGSDIWVLFRDLPDATRDALWKKHKASVAFPAGPPPIKDESSGNDMPAFLRPT
jgi:hypothetical protein